MSYKHELRLIKHQIMSLTLIIVLFLQVIFRQKDLLCYLAVLQQSCQVLETVTIEEDGL